MARKKKNEKKMIKALIAIIIVIIASIFEINISEIDLSDTNSVLTSIFGEENTYEIIFKISQNIFTKSVRYDI